MRTFHRTGRRFVPEAALLLALAAALGAVNSRSATEAPPGGPDWVRAGANTNRPLWGIRGGLLWGLPAPGTPRDGPRGLIRLWSPVLTNGGYDLVNFIALEPVVKGRRGYSELERSALDGVSGKRLQPGTSRTDRHPPRIRTRGN